MVKQTVIVSSDDTAFAAVLKTLPMFRNVTVVSDDPAKPVAAMQDSATAVATSDILLPVLSKAVPRSEWILDQISKFSAKNPGKIIPMTLDSTDSCDVGLGSTKCFDCSTDLYKKVPDIVAAVDAVEKRCYFERSLAARGVEKQFDGSPVQVFERRNGQDRRLGIERRVFGDRRVSGLKIRLRKGLWLAFHRATELGKFDYFPLYEPLPHNRGGYNFLKFVDALWYETSKYHFLRQSNWEERNPRDVVFEAAARVAQSKSAHRQDGIIYAIEDVADVIWADHIVQPIDRRAGNDRRQRARRTVSMAANIA